MDEKIREAALERFESYRDYAMRFSRALCRKFPNEAEDLPQICLMELWLCSLRYDESRGVKFATYLAFRVRWRLADALRALSPMGMDRDQSYRYLQMPQIPIGEAEEVGKVFGATPDDPIEPKHSEHDLYEWLMSRVPKRLRSLASLRHRDGFTLSQCAEAMGLSKSRVMVLDHELTDVLRGSYRYHEALSGESLRKPPKAF